MQIGRSEVDGNLYRYGQGAVQGIGAEQVQGAIGIEPAHAKGKSRTQTRKRERLLKSAVSVAQQNAGTGCNVQFAIPVEVANVHRPANPARDAPNALKSTIPVSQQH